MPFVVESQLEGRATIYALQGGQRLAVGVTPAGNEFAAHGQEIVAAAFRGVADLDAARRVVAGDTHLTAAGREARIAPLLEAAAKAVAKAETDLDTWTAYIAAYAAKTFGPPPLDPGDSVGASLDRERRDWLRSLSNTERTKLLDTLAGDQELLKSVMRSPIPLGPLSDYAPTVWREIVLNTDPHGRRVLASQEALVWVASIVPQLSKALGIKPDPRAPRAAPPPGASGHS